MMTDEKPKLLDHNYDGIQELDNDLPRWWLYLFYITIICAVVYMLYYHVFDIGYLSADEYMREMNPNYIRVQESDIKLFGILDSYHSPFYKTKGDITPRMLALGMVKEPFIEETVESDTVTYTALSEKADILKGKDIFIKNCTQCHGMAGEGGIGPNLTDKYWLHGGMFNDVIKSIKYGYPSKGMIAWRGFLKPKQILQAGSFVASIQETNPPNPKAPQGVLVED